MSKKFLFVMLAAVLTAGALTGCGKKTRSIAEDEKLGIKFSKNKKTLLKYNSELKDTEYTIPKGVKIIGARAFENCENLTSVTIPEGVEIINPEAFKNCKKLTGVTIPKGVKFVGAKAFENCENLTGVTIPEGVKFIGIGAFENCENLTDVTIPEGVETIGDRAFSECVKLKKVTIPSSVISNLYRIGLPIEKLSFDRKIFRVDGSGAIINTKMRALNGLPLGIHGAYTIPSGVTTIGDNAFSGCRCLTSVTIPSSVTTIGYNAFSECVKLKKVTIPEGVKTIGFGVFQNCSSLTGVTIPSSVTTIGNHAFSRCKSVKAAPGHPIFYNDASGALIDRKKNMLLHLPADHSGAYTIPSGVTTIGDGAFSGCESLTGVTIPSGVTTIGFGAFWGCESLTSVTIPSSVTTIGDWAFSECPCEKSVREQFPNYRSR